MERATNKHYIVYPLRAFFTCNFSKSHSRYKLCSTLSRQDLVRIRFKVGWEAHLCSFVSAPSPSQYPQSCRGSPSWWRRRVMLSSKYQMFFFSGFFNRSVSFIIRVLKYYSVCLPPPPQWRGKGALSALKGATTTYS